MPINDTTGLDGFAEVRWGRRRLIACLETLQLLPSTAATASLALKHVSSLLLVLQHGTLSCDMDILHDEPRLHLTPAAGCAGAGWRPAVPPGAGQRHGLALLQPLAAGLRCAGPQVSGW